MGGLYMYGAIIGPMYPVNDPSLWRMVKTVCLGGATIRGVVSRFKVGQVVWAARKFAEKAITNKSVPRGVSMAMTSWHYSAPFVENIGRVLVVARNQVCRLWR